MVENNQAHDKSGDSDYKPDPERQPVVNLIGSAIFGLFILYWICRGLKDEIFWQVFIGASVNWFILLAMFFQAHITKQQWRAMQKQSKLMSDGLELGEKSRQFTESSFYLAERAYLAIHTVEPRSYPNDYGLIIWPLMPGRDPMFSFTITNGGRTPAFNVSAAVYTAIAENLAAANGNWKQSPRPFRKDFLFPEKSEHFESAGNMKPPEGYNEAFNPVSRYFYFVKIVMYYWDISTEADPNKDTYIFRYGHDEGVIQWSHETKRSAKIEAEGTEN